MTATADALAIARDPATPGQVLTENILAVNWGADNNEVWSAAVANPNIPAAVAKTWAGRYPIAVIQNAGLPMWLLEDPTFFAGFNDGVLETLTKCALTLTPPLHNLLGLLGLWVQVGGERTQLAILLWDGCTPGLLAAVASRNFPMVTRVKGNAVLYELAKHPYTAADVLINLAACNDSRIAGALAGNPNLPVQAMKQLVYSGTQWTRGCLLNNPNLPPELRVYIGKNDK